MNKSNKFSKFFYTIGTVLVVILLIISSYNFVHDARVFNKSVLASAENKTSDTKKVSQDEEEYKTLEYKKSTSSDNTNENKKKSKKDTKKETEQQPVPDP